MTEEEAEARAREVLAAMQERVARGPHAALGIAMHATASDVRTAFLELTKVFHPARFGRMATDVQRLSNEVFLGIRGAHDALAKPKMRATGPLTPNAQRPPTSPSSRATSTLPTVKAPTNPQQQVVKSPTGQQPTVTKPPTGPNPIKPAAPLVRPPSDPIAPPRRVPTASPSPERRATPATGVRIAAPAKPAVAATKSSGAMPVLDREVAPIFELMQKLQWAQARTAITALLARSPSSTKYQALMSYARGREAQLSGLRDEARVELDTALQLDPDLQLAKTALGELFTRRK